MGIKGLWGVLTPYSEKKSLHEIRGETIAVDLSGWICDSQNVTDYFVQPKLYLRNLFFRTVYLLLMDIKPIFVLEGDAPELKRDVMAARNAIQFCGAAPRSEASTNKRPDVGRKRFKGVLKECENLLKTMGVSCVKGHGEAEATCAQLNADGLVNAVVSQDSDCFAYGAHRVYRNFSVSNSAGGGALQGSVDCYDARKMMEQNGFGRNKMVALALLCGCDYGVGACGTSIATCVSFLHTVPDTEIVPRLVSWVSEPEVYERKSRWVSVPGRCDRCGHAGRSHLKNGCPVCVTHKGCEDTGHKAKVAETKRELSLRSRALSCGAPFPEPKVMKEFLSSPPEAVTLDNLKSQAPSLIKFIKLMRTKLDWSERYCVEKFLPLLTKFHMQESVPCRTILPVKIKKKRTPRGVPSYEIIWHDIDGQYDGLIPDDQFDEGEDLTLPWTTTERQDLVQRFYPKLVEQYDESIKKPTKEKKPSGKKKKDDESEKPKRKYNKKVKQLINDAEENLSRSLNNMNISKTELNASKANVSVKVVKLKRKLKNTKVKNQKTIESFISKRRKSKKLAESLRCSFRDIKCDNDDVYDFLSKSHDGKENNLDGDKVSGLPVHSHVAKQNRVVVKSSMSIINISEDEINESELSDIVDKIVKKAPITKTAKVNNNTVRLVFERKFSTPRKSAFRKSVLNEIPNNCSTPRDSPVRRQSFVNISRTSISKVNTSYFFDKLSEDCDAFEMSLVNKIIDSDSEKTENYSVPYDISLPNCNV